MKITLRQLNVFVQTAKHKNLSLAAHASHVSQSAASMSLSQLETSLGKNLFDREGKKLILNETGKHILPLAHNILEQANILESAITHLDEYSGHIHIAASTTIANNLFPEKLAQFRKRHPNITLELSALNTEACIHKLLNFEVDMSFIEGQYLHPKIQLSAFAKDQLTVFCHPKHSLANKNCLSAKTLAQYPWILRESASGTRQALDAALQQSELTLSKTTIINSSQAIKNWIQHDKQALACLSESVLSNELKSKKLKRLKVQGWNLQRPLYQAHYRNKIPSPLHQLLEDFLKNIK